MPRSQSGRNGSATSRQVPDKSGLSPLSSPSPVPPWSVVWQRARKATSSPPSSRARRMPHLSGQRFMPRRSTIMCGSGNSSTWLPRVQIGGSRVSVASALSDRVPDVHDPAVPPPDWRPDPGGKDRRRHDPMGGRNGVQSVRQGADGASGPDGCEFRQVQGSGVGASGMGVRRKIS